MDLIASLLHSAFDKLYHYGLPFVVVLSVLVFVHEFGHFWVARRCKVKVEAFSIGFGPELFGWTDRLGTRWRVSAIPLGGFVKMFGDADASSRPDNAAGALMDDEARKVSFMHKKLWQKALVVAAGPATNFLFAIFALAVLFAIFGQQFTPAVISEVTSDSAAASAGLRKGDVIVSIDGRHIQRFEELRNIVLMHPGEPLDLGIERDGAALSLVAVPHAAEMRDRFGGEHVIGQLGVRPSEETVLRREDPATALWQATRETWSMATTILDTVWQMVIGTRGTEDIGGVITIGQVSGELWREGFVPLVTFMASLSINLGLINLFPIPMLDGGHLLFYAIEAVRGRPIGDRVLAFGFRIGLALVLSLVVFSLWHDLVRLMHVSSGT